MNSHSDKNVVKLAAPGAVILFDSLVSEGVLREVTSKSLPHWNLPSKVPRPERNGAERTSRTWTPSVVTRLPQWRILYTSWRTVCGRTVREGSGRQTEEVQVEVPRSLHDGPQPRNAEEAERHWWIQHLGSLNTSTPMDVCWWSSLELLHR